MSHTGVKWQRTASQTHWPGHLKLQHWEDVKWPKNRGSSDTWEAVELHVGEGQHGMGLSVKKGKRNREMSRETHPRGEKDCREWRGLEFISWGTWWICVCRDGWGGLVFLYWYPLSVDAILSYQSKAKQNKTATKQKKKMAGLWWTPQLILAHTGKPNSQIWTLCPFQQRFFFLSSLVHLDHKPFCSLVFSCGLVSHYALLPVSDSLTSDPSPLYWITSMFVPEFLRKRSSDHFFHFFFF